MAINPEYAGRTFEPSEPYEVSRVKIAEFATAIGDASPLCRDRAAAQAAGYPDVIAPPTFAIAVTMRAGHQVIMDPELGIDYSRVVHGEQRFVHHRPIHAGDLLRVVVSVEDIRQAAGNDIVTTKSDVQTVDGEAVLSAYSTIVARGTAQ